MQATTGLQNQLLDKLLQTISEKHGTFNESESLTAFRAIKGQMAQGELMVVGRAVNGWADPWLPLSMGNVDERKRRISEVTERARSFEGGCPMLFVTKWKDGNFHKSRSAFWCVIEKVISRLSISDIEKEKETWPSHLIWSNLYKISPWKGRNPSAGLMNIQRETCTELLKAEVEEWKPKRILFLTGAGWVSQFLKKLGNLQEDKDSISLRTQYVERAGILQINSYYRTTFVVSKHPERKPQEPIANEITQVFGSYGLLHNTQT